MHISTRNPCINYSLGDVAISQVTEEKDLGVIIDHHLKFHEQTAAAVSKASQVLSLIKRSFVNLDSNTLACTYFSRH